MSYGTVFTKWTTIIISSVTAMVQAPKRRTLPKLAKNVAQVTNGPETMDPHF